MFGVLLFSQRQVANAGGATAIFHKEQFHRFALAGQNKISSKCFKTNMMIEVLCRQFSGTYLV
jgi:hypothetical protein